VQSWRHPDRALSAAGYSLSLAAAGWHVATLFIGDGRSTTAPRA
jgi:hypothetical protein